MKTQTHLQSSQSHKTRLLAIMLLALLCLALLWGMASMSFANLQNVIQLTGMPALDAAPGIADWEAPVCRKNCTAGMPALDADSAVADEGTRGTDRSNIV